LDNANAINEDPDRRTIDAGRVEAPRNRQSQNRARGKNCALALRIKGREEVEERRSPLLPPLRIC
jgi:hypothetical protein